MPNISQPLNIPQMLSIDIGIHNLGWCVWNKEDMVFGLYDIDANLPFNDDVVVSRVSVINSFVKEIFTEYPSISVVVIERQVNVNTMAMELMYALTATVYNFCKKIVIFDPKLKFTTLSLKYSTQNKAHKKLSVAIVRNYLANERSHLLPLFDCNKKRDDVADAILMLLVLVFKSDKAALAKLIPNNLV